ncbi:MAG: HDOD domain-containing protein [Aquabacterium sp.]|nr:HDOD domain-containing protein [Aquabacterium sp.]
MGFISFIQRFLGLVEDEAQPMVALKAITPNTRPAPEANPASPPTVSVSVSLDAMLLREEILDKHGRLAGYRFSFKVPHDGRRVSADAYLEALRAARVQAFAERRLALIVVSLDDWLAGDFAVLNATHTVFQINLPNDQPLHPDWLAGLQVVRDSGAGVALSCASGLTALRPAMAIATHGLVDFTDGTVEQVEKQITTLRRDCPALTLIIENVSLWPEQRLCMSLGGAYAMGYFLATVDKQNNKEKLTDSRLVLMDMLNQVRNDADAQVLADLAKRDPGIAVHILSMANASAMGMTTPVTAMDQAITALGREALYRWLAVSIFRTGNDHGRDAALLEVALSRARFLELAALDSGTKQQADELFLVGLLSFVDTLLGMPIQDIVAAISLPPVVLDVLLHSQGPYVPYLLLALSVEKCNMARASQLASQLGIDPTALSHYRDEALLWAEVTTNA